MVRPRPALRALQLLLLVSAACVFLTTGREASAGAIVVTSADDSGPGTLRAAIGEANTNPGPDTITFDPAAFPPAAAPSIDLASPLETIDGSQPLTIDGSGAGVIINGGNLGSAQGLHVVSGDIADITLRTISLEAFGSYTIYLDSANNISNVNLVDVKVSLGSNYGIWLKATTSITDVLIESVSSSANDNYGLFVSSSLGNTTDITVRDSTFDDNGNYGMYIAGVDVADVEIEDVRARGNANYGVHLRADNNLQRASLDTVTTSGNSNHGVTLRADSLLANVVITALDSRTNTNRGLDIIATEIDDVTITDSGFASNLNDGVRLDAVDLDEISLRDSDFIGNAGAGVNFAGSGSITSSTIMDNTFVENGTGILIFGFDSAGVGGLTVIGNTIVDSTAGAGIDMTAIVEAAGNIVADNTISGNALDGIVLYIRAHTVISQNRIFGNGELGIDLADPADVPPGVTPNDAGDGDVGPNGLLNAPEWALTIGYEIAEGTACPGCLVEIFRADVDPTNRGEGAEFLGEVTADSAGDFAFPICGVLAGEWITATATNSAGHTSEFSQNYLALEDAPLCRPIQGDLDCDRAVTPFDALIALRFLEDLPFGQDQPCPALDDEIGDFHFADVNCDGVIDEQDTVAILAYLAGVQIPPEGGCTPIGETH